MRASIIQSAAFLKQAAFIVSLLPFTAMAQDFYTNDLKGAVGIHDPSSIIKCKGVYYVYATGGGMKYSADRITWADGEAFIAGRGAAGAGTLAKQAWWDTHGGQIWAPEVAFMDGVYYGFYSVSNSGNVDNSAIGVATNLTLDPKDPTYKWTDKGKVIDSKIAGAATFPNVNAIDPATFLDDDGKWYLVFGSFNEGVRMIELNRATGMAMQNPPVVTVMTDHTGEASFIFKWKTNYYYSVSRGKCCAGSGSDYQVIYGKSTTKVTGPYLNSNGSNFKVYDEAKNTLLVGKGGAYAGGAGGQSFFWDRDTLFMDYHAYLSSATQLFIKPVYADANGWLSLDKSKGTVITGAPNLVVGITLAPPINGSASQGLSGLRMLGAGLGVSDKFAGHLYTLEGQKLPAQKPGAFPAGIYVEKSASGF